ncbi:MAG: phosphoglycerate mutase (2,3-diphosphoglycerate-independent) [Deltaproteobacteria bacterium]|nr:phosphoglycerate mutase (2,3-diphosphoglycerate-independent) [Deltaproteobacteria bacterium]
MSSNKHHEMSEKVRSGYKEGDEDETLYPLVLVNGDSKPIGRFQRGDAVIFYNVRGEREIELTRSLTEKGFAEFPVEKGLDLHFATMIEYQKGLNVRVAFPPDDVIEGTLSETIARHRLWQVKITEAEKAVHVGYFMNGKRDEPFPGEERIIIPSRKDVKLFDEAPEMSIEDVAAATIKKIRDPDVHFICTNFPNVDVVGHIENEQAVVRAIEAVDYYTGRVIDEAVKNGVTAIICADHGTVEKWLFPDGAVNTGHTDSPVPFVLIGDHGDVKLRKSGELTDIAPTILQLMDIPKPEIMTGTSLIKKSSWHKIKQKKRVLLLILDGWGVNGRDIGNLIALSRTPNMDRLCDVYPYTTLEASGEAVGLFPTTVGNSEAGHLHIGAGRKIFADMVLINHAIEDGYFFHNEAFSDVMKAAKKNRRSLHLMGIVSFFSSHGSIRTLFALMEMAKREDMEKVFIHAMLGRRGEMPESGANYIRKIEEKAAELKLGKVASVIGRYWSMDREYNWDRIEKTYRMLVMGEGIPVPERS